MEINRLKLLELMTQLTDEQQTMVMEFLEKTAAANMAMKKLAVYGSADMDLAKDAGNTAFTNAVSAFVESGNRIDFEIFHTIGKRFCKKDFGGATEAEQKQNIDNMIQKQGKVIGRYYIAGAYLTVELDYARPEDDGKYIVQVSMENEESLGK